MVRVRHTTIHSFDLNSDVIIQPVRFMHLIHIQFLFRSVSISRIWGVIGYQCSLNEWGLGLMIAHLVILQF